MRGLGHSRSRPRAAKPTRRTKTAIVLDVGRGEDDENRIDLETTLLAHTVDPLLLKLRTDNYQELALQKVEDKAPLIIFINYLEAYPPALELGRYLTLYETSEAPAGGDPETALKTFENSSELLHQIAKDAFSFTRTIVFHDLNERPTASVSRPANRRAQIDVQIAFTKGTGRTSSDRAQLYQQLLKYLSKRGVVVKEGLPTSPGDYGLLVAHKIAGSPAPRWELSTTSDPDVVRDIVEECATYRGRRVAAVYDLRGKKPLPLEVKIVASYIDPSGSQFFGEAALDTDAPLV